MTSCSCGYFFIAASIVSGKKQAYATPHAVPIPTRPIPIRIRELINVNTVRYGNYFGKPRNREGPQSNKDNV
jgi:hypothetical protein